MNKNRIKYTVSGLFWAYNKRKQQDLKIDLKLAKIASAVNLIYYLSLDYLYVFKGKFYIVSNLKAYVYQWTLHHS